MCYTTILITDKFDNPQIKEDMYSYLHKHGVTEILEYDNLDSLDENFKNLEDIPYLIFFNISYRIFNLNDVLIFIKENKFQRVSLNRNLLYFVKDDTFKVSKDSICIDEKDKNNIMFDISNANTYFIKPVLDELPRIICYTHHRSTYLRLTLNSLMYSLEHCPEIPVTIVLNDPTQDTLHVALEFGARYKQIDILKTNVNVAFAAVNIAVQWYRPKYIIIAEDDFILNSSVKTLYPTWAYDFCYRLNHFEMVGWRASFDNIPCNALYTWLKPENKTQIGWFNYKPYGYPIMAQLLALKTDFWLSCIDNSLSKTPLDIHLLMKTKNISSPYTVGYHIGFNQEMDNFNIDKRFAFNMAIRDVKVTNLKTFEERTINLDDISKL